MICSLLTVRSYKSLKLRNYGCFCRLNTDGNERGLCAQWFTSGVHEMTSSPSLLFTLVGMLVKCHQPLHVHVVQMHRTTFYRTKFIETTELCEWMKCVANELNLWHQGNVSFGLLQTLLLECCNASNSMSAINAVYWCQAKCVLSKNGQVFLASPSTWGNWFSLWSPVAASASMCNFMRKKAMETVCI